MKINRNQLFLPINYEVLIDENDPVWKVVEICDTLNYTRLYDEYLRHWRSIDPVVMFSCGFCRDNQLPTTLPSPDSRMNG